ncbi:uncharacterized protein B0H18DRAFT_444542 [Fomitopsis serialis]|uniref:uncharacterized protein n=1 Tax=Fomitopsis serialis TaxID=139415 RepID=UPI00200884C1|nr:uncharacterized protein B0H18DRAFT_444542 [Neoantrodia serialis]KAH9924036.1 hypothetical protein B0H18DRAFT_444542 [Neoantrodia serialis]
MSPVQGAKSTVQPVKSQLPATTASPRPAPAHTEPVSAAPVPPTSSTPTVQRPTISAQPAKPARGRGDLDAAQPSLNPASAKATPDTKDARSVPPVALALKTAPATVPVNKPVEQHTDKPLKVLPKPLRPAASTTAPAAPTASMSFHDFLAGLPPTSHVTSPLRAPVSNYPASVRGCSKLRLKMQPTYWEPLKPIVDIPQPPCYVHQVHTYSNFDSAHYAWALAEQAARKAEAALATAEHASAGLEAGPTPPAQAYNPETEDYDSPLMPGYLSLDALSVGHSESSDDTDNSSFCGSEGEFEPGADGHWSDGHIDEASLARWRRVKMVARMAQGAGLLAGIAVKAVYVGARGVAGWWSRAR